MDIIRKIQYLLFCLLVIGFVACDDDDNNSTETGYEEILTQLAEEVDATAEQLREFFSFDCQYRTYHYFDQDPGICG